MTEQPVGTPLSMHDPQVVGPWRLYSRLGAGGMGVVFYGSAPGHGTAAVKVIRPGLLDAPATRDRFRREVAILQSVRDVHISQFLAADLESEPAWLAIEYISGPVLRDEVLEHGPLSEDVWWEVVRGLAQALAVLEVHRITHRDLKPANVILNERGPVVIDFGIAHPEDATALTGTGLVTGSPAWLSPEQANLEPTGPASDIFTLGSLLAFAATGRPPFGEGVSVAVLVAIASKDPDLDGIDPTRTALLRRMLAKEPGQRPTARQILDRTRAAAAGRPPAAMPTARPGPPPSESAAPAPVPDQPAPDSTRPEGFDPADPVALGAGDEPGAVGLPPSDGRAGGVPAAEATAVGAVESPQPRPTPAPTPQARAGTGSGTGPATAPATSPSGPPRRSGSFAARLLGALAALALVVAGGWWVVNSLDLDEPEAPPTNTETSAPPPSAGEAPTAPSSDQLRDGDWLLESYRFTNTGSDMTVEGTISNRGSETSSAVITVWVYLATGQSLGSVTQAVTDVPAGGSVAVTMTGDAVWEPGPKVVLVQAS